DKLYFESETYTKGREEVRRGLACGVFYQMEDNSIWVDLSSLGLDKKALLRSDGTTMYITQDIGTAIFRAQDWPFDQLLYVVGNEQNYHFKVLFFVLRLLGYPWAQQLHHVSYGMVNLPHGRMKSREGTVVDADDILDRLHSAAEEEIAKKGRENALKHAQCIAENVAIAALHYFLLQVSPQKDMVFHPEESLSFNGNTGPYLQYMGARISSLLKKVQEDVEQKGPREVRCDPALLTHEAEWELVKALARFPACVTR
ncbi:arginine--tRNA ligase, partial [Treponema pallidum]